MFSSTLYYRKNGLILGLASTACIQFSTGNSELALTQKYFKATFNSGLLKVAFFVFNFYHFMPLSFFNFTF